MRSMPLPSGVIASAKWNQMEHPGFFERAGPFSLARLGAVAEASLANGADPEVALSDVRPLDVAAKGDLSFLDNPKYLPLFAARTGAPASLPRNLPTTRRPQPPALSRPSLTRFARPLLLFYPDAMKPKAPSAGAGTHPYPFKRGSGSGCDRGGRCGNRPEASIGRVRRSRPAASSAIACISAGIAISARTPR